jgi:hypothetical protein
MTSLPLYLLGLVLLCKQATMAQRLAPGYVITASGDSIRGAIRLSSPMQQQFEVKFVPLLLADRLLKLAPSDLRAYGYVYNHDTARYVACPMQVGYPVRRSNGYMANDTSWLLLKQLIAGPVQLYERYTAGNTGWGNSHSSRQYWIRKGSAVPVNTYWWNFSKDAAAFFQDNPMLAVHLRAKHYQARDLKPIIQLYNSWRLDQEKATTP